MPLSDSRLANEPATPVRAAAVLRRHVSGSVGTRRRPAAGSAGSRSGRRPGSSASSSSTWTSTTWIRSPSHCCSAPWTVSCELAASASLLGAKTSSSRPLPKVGRLTRSPGAVKSTCSTRSRMCSSSRRRGRAAATVDAERVVDVRSCRLHPHLGHDDLQRRPGRGARRRRCPGAAAGPRRRGRASRRPSTAPSRTAASGCRGERAAGDRRTATSG